MCTGVLRAETKNLNRQARLFIFIIIFHEFIWCIFLDDRDGETLVVRPEIWYISSGEWFCCYRVRDRHVNTFTVARRPNANLTEKKYSQPISLTTVCRWYVGRLSIWYHFTRTWRESPLETMTNRIRVAAVLYGRELIKSLIKRPKQHDYVMRVWYNDVQWSSIRHARRVLRDVNIAGGELIN